ncbi:MAG: flavin reductase family protein [Candidatus Latescibacteria bacterium]|nr:flavin reductase family protein [Candidatus Latescibacterota bacterium]
MFYRPEEGHTLAHNPFNALVVPRPIGWISTLDEEGRANLAPYSFFNAVAYEPPQVMFAATTDHAYGGLKDSVQNARQTGEFVVNLATWALRRQMNASAVPAPRDVDEFDYAELAKAPAQLVKPHRVAQSPAQLECLYTRSVELEGESNTVVFGQVVGVHIDDRFIVDGLVDTLAMEPIGRLGYLDYVKVAESFSLERPQW